MPAGAVPAGSGCARELCPACRVGPVHTLCCMGTPSPHLHVHGCVQTCRGEPWPRLDAQGTDTHCEAPAVCQFHSELTVHWPTGSSWHTEGGATVIPTYSRGRRERRSQPHGRQRGETGQADRLQRPRSSHARCPCSCAIRVDAVSPRMCPENIRGCVCTQAHLWSSCKHGCLVPTETWAGMDIGAYMSVYTQAQVCTFQLAYYSYSHRHGWECTWVHKCEHTGHTCLYVHRDAQAFGVQLDVTSQCTHQWDQYTHTHTHGPT